MAEYTTDYGTKITNVHKPSECVGEHCVIHNPSERATRIGKTHWRGDRGIMERVCEHGVGHPDPDSLENIRRVLGDKRAAVESVHGCDGCCA